ncbi:hypothetical protein RSOLAG22IIIB_08431 [Rhizoctonia solani]|uniref:Uncharacterized protein n=1 Tax=Rhizoctonia solani TaxID=456999 RepID=A0A0K6FT76_9AGAM|nr:hypothetical protein RSOLAG22IIIB_08431 [Rhizoctonia solani]
MPPQQFLVRLQHGITGGFVPATPNAIHQLTRSSDTPGSLFIESMVRPEGTRDLQPHPPKDLAIGDSSHGSNALVEELHSILKTIPTEKPPGSEDIYGLDTSIMWMSDDLEWVNTAPQGCVGGGSEVKPTEEQIAKFKRAVEIVDELTKLEK